ncbi:unnamed protein product [Rotaria sp. Silwood2]|nr:unnamed protein product [Rotaria sp. Silwood2]
MASSLTDEHKKLNPKCEVPVLIIDGKRLLQSIPIIEYIDETYQIQPRLLPDDPYQRYQVARLISEIIASGIQPLQNLKVLKRVGEDKKTEWAHDFVKAGLGALEKTLEESAGQYCVGDQISIADCCLVPQLYNARLYDVDLTAYPIMSAIGERLNELPAFKEAHPNRQFDCPDEEKIKS